MTRSDSAGSRETRVIHDVHRRATSTLADLWASPCAPAADVAEFRDFVVAMLEHHHTSEDEDLWPLLISRAAHLEPALRDLTEEHDELQQRLDELRVSPVGQGDASDLCDLVHRHLSHEEPSLLPALDRYVSDEEWDQFSARTVATAPQEGLPFLLALIDEIATPEDAELIFSHVPAAARATIPARRADGARALAALR